MQYLALVVDYDGTIAHDGVVDDPTLDALGRARKSGRLLVLATGRELDDLAATFPRCDLFHRVVAENWALLYRPDTGDVRALTGPPPPLLVFELARRGVLPLSVGRTIVAPVDGEDSARG
jgi:hydroxymethylpyrimidine pyrophosphatase-like HAD family hydrolase